MRIMRNSRHGQGDVWWDGCCRHHLLRRVISRVRSRREKRRKGSAHVNRGRRRGDDEGEVRATGRELQWDGCDPCAQPGQQRLKTTTPSLDAMGRRQRLGGAQNIYGSQLTLRWRL